MEGEEGEGGEGGEGLPSTWYHNHVTVWAVSCVAQ